MLRRLIIAALAMLLLSVIAIIALGWAVRPTASGKVHRWVARVLGEERSIALRDRYLLLLAHTLPADRDGDGFPDSVEHYERTSPTNAADHAVTYLFLADAGFDGGPEYGEGGLFFQLQPGSRRRIRVQLAADWRPRIFAPGMTWQFTADPPLELCLPGGVPSSAPVLATMDADGIMELDLAVGPDIAPATTYWFPEVLLAIRAVNPRLPTEYHRMSVGVVWPQPPLACQVEREPNSRIDDKFQRVILHWKPVRSGLETYYIEATRDPSAREWFTMGLVDPDRGKIGVVFSLHDSHARHRAPIQFRLIPSRMMNPPPKK